MNGNWRIERLGDVCDLIARGVAPVYLESGGVCVVNQKCVRDHTIDYSLARRHDNAAKIVPEERLIRLGDVLVNSTGTGTLGRVAQVRIAPQEPTTVDTHVTIVRPKARLFHPDFFGYAMRAIEAAITAAGEGASGQTELPRNRLASDFEVTFPETIAEQQHVVAILDEAFAQIALATHLADTNAANAADLQRSCLEAELQRAASGRDMAPLDSFCPEDRPITYGVVKLGEQVDGGTPCLRTSNVRWLAIEERGLKSISPALSTEYRRTILRGGEVLVNVRGTLGGVAVVPSEMAGWNISREVAIVPNEPKRSSSEFLAFWIASQASQQWLTSMTTGAAYVGINIADLRKLPVPKLSLADQEHVVERIQRVLREQADLIRISERKLSCLEELKQSLLASAFSGELMAESEAINDSSFATPEEAANILAFMHWRHKRANRSRFFGHVMAQKALDLVERVGGVELGRRPYKDAAGPNDKPHMTAAEAWAKDNQFFEFVERPGGGYDFTPLANHGALLSAAKTKLQPIEAELGRVSNILIGKNKIEAEIFATVLAAWNNLIIDGKDATEAAILHEARDEWHPDKVNLPVAKFQDAIREIRRLNLIPDGSAKAVRHKQAALF